jgi:transposase-like protein
MHQSGPRCADGPRWNWTTLIESLAKSGLNRRRFCREEEAVFGRADQRDLKQAELGTPVEELCRQHGVSQQSFYRWKKVYGGVLTGEARELKQLRDENTKLKRLVADLSLNKVMLQDVLKKRVLKPIKKREVVVT